MTRLRRLTEPVLVRLDPETLRLIDELALRAGRTRTQEVRLAVQRHLHAAFPVQTDPRGQVVTRRPEAP